MFSQVKSTGGDSDAYPDENPYPKSENTPKKIVKLTNKNLDNIQKELNSDTTLNSNSGLYV